MAVGEDDVHAELRGPGVYGYCEVNYLSCWVGVVTGDGMECPRPRICAYVTEVDAGVYHTVVGGFGGPFVAWATGYPPSVGQVT